MLHPGDWVTWGKDHLGQVRYFSDDQTTAYVKVQNANDLVRVAMHILRKLHRWEAA